MGDIFAAWLEVSRLSENDAIFVLSVGGGDPIRNVSVNLVKAIDLAKQRGARVWESSVARTVMP